jgi:hypothetical protein
MTGSVEVLAAVLNGICQGLALTAAVWAALRMARLGAAARYAVWMGALVVLAALPVVNLAWPRQAEAAAGAAGTAAMPGVMLPPPGAWTIWVFASWAAMAGVLLARLAGSYAGLARLKRSAVAGPEALERRYALVARRSLESDGPGAGWKAGAQPGKAAPQGMPPVRCADVPVPVAAGLWRPAILLPSALVAELSPPELDQILLHELAHVRRRDDWTNLAVRLIEALCFFHPAVWWIGRRLSVEREIACDDIVVRGTGGAVPYAACLMKLARGALARRSPQLAHAAVSGKREFSLRIEALLAATRRAGSPKAAVAAMLVGLVAAAAAAPELGVFSAPLPPAPAAVYKAVPWHSLQAVNPGPHRLKPVLRRAHRLKPVPQQPVVVDTYYVLYLNEDGPRWIQVLWLHPLPERSKLDGI